MAEYHEQVIQRGMPTIAIWGQYHPTFTVGTLTLAQHTLDLEAINTDAGLRDLAQDEFDDARTARESALALITDLNIAVPRALSGQLLKSDPLFPEINDCYKIIPSTPDKAIARARRVINLWTRVNVAWAAQVPPLPALTVRQKTVAQLLTAVSAIPALLQSIQDKETIVNLRKSSLQQAADKVDANNKRWYAAWSGNYAPGSAESDALSQINTGAPTPDPVARELHTVTPQAGGHFAITYVAGGGAHATTEVLEWQVGGVDDDFGHGVPLVPAGQSVATGAAAGQTVAFRATGTNSSGATSSAVKSGVAQ